MKVRYDFVTNSSSSSYIIATKVDVNPEVLLVEFYKSGRIKPDLLTKTAETINYGLTNKIAFNDAFLRWERCNKEILYRQTIEELDEFYHQNYSHYKSPEEILELASYQFCRQAIEDGFKICGLDAEDWAEPFESLYKEFHDRPYYGENMRFFVTDNYE